MTSFIPPWLRKDGEFLWVIFFFSHPPGDTLDSVEELYAFVFVSVAPKCLVEPCDRPSCSRDPPAPTAESPNVTGLLLKPGRDSLNVSAPLTRPST